MTSSTYAIAIGSNRWHHLHGRPERVVTAAIDALAALGRVQAHSPVLRTAALGPAGRSFANAALLLESELDPPALLGALKRLERSFGRRGGRRWGPRVLDLDIILWSGGAWSGRGLTVPHPEFRRRAFVLRPMLRIAADWRDPLTGRSIAQLAHAVDRRRALA